MGNFGFTSLCVARGPSKVQPRSGLFHKINDSAFSTVLRASEIILYVLYSCLQTVQRSDMFHVELFSVLIRLPDGTSWLQSQQYPVPHIVHYISPLHK